MDKYEVAAKKLEMVINGDSSGLRDLKKQEEQGSQMYLPLRLETLVAACAR